MSVSCLSRRGYLTLLGMALWLGFPGAGQAATIKVPKDKTTIQAAIDAAVNGDVVVVAAGRYLENIDFKGKAIRVRSTNPADPAVVAATIIDGNKQGSVVTFKSGERLDSQLRGFTITNGTGTVVGDLTRGGGIHCINSSSPTLANNVISGNSAYYGGGVSCNGSSPLVTNSTISENTASWDGGGICCDHSSPCLTSNTITGNQATNGAGVYATFSAIIVLTSNVISANVGGKALRGGEGGGCISRYLRHGSRPTRSRITKPRWGPAAECAATAAL